MAFIITFYSSDDDCGKVLDKNFESSTAFFKATQIKRDESNFQAFFTLVKIKYQYQKRLKLQTGALKTQP